jgi:mono/diheme cytochrome c family protein
VTRPATRPVTCVPASLAALALAPAALAACDVDLSRMNDQPRCEPLDRRPWLPDQRCDQPTPEGTVPWRAATAPAAAPAPSRATIARGGDRFRRFCAPCHGALGDGDSPVARDMVLRPPPSLHAAAIVAYPDQRIFEVITAGYGMMPPYGDMLLPQDRWAVVHYVRVLQRSQAVPLEALAPARREEARRWLP